jgi:DNA-binding transcriptional regulator/RsmH inhibitor MraZ
LIKHADLKKEVVVVGNYDSLEVWNKKAWQAYEKDLDASASETAQRLAGGS